MENESLGIFQEVNPPARSSLASRLILSALVAMLVRSGAAAAVPDDYWDPSIGIPGPDGPVMVVLVVGDTLYAAGRFSQIGGVFANSIAKFDTNGWSALGDGITVGLLPSILALAHHDGQLYVGGAFGQAGNVPVNNIARWDGTNWFPCREGVGVLGNGIVRAMAIGGDKLIVGGTFNFLGGLTTPNIALWDGTNWAALGNGISGIAVDSVATSGTTIYAGGRFRLGGGVNATNIAMWNGMSWVALGEGIRDWDVSGGGGGMVRTLLSVENGVVAGGAFRLAGVVSAINISKWDGITWRALGSGIDYAGSVYALALNGTDLYAAGFFASAGETQALAIAKWDGSVWSPLGSGTMSGIDPGGLDALAVTGSELYLGGFFDHAGGKPANNIALWHIPHSLSIERTGNNVTLSWPATGTNFLLEATSDLGAPNWQGVSATPGIINYQCVVTIPLGPGNQFYRLRRK